MGTLLCCTRGPERSEMTLTGPENHAHHSVYIHPEASLSNASENQAQASYSVVYRPPHLNERLAPGEARHKFWENPLTDNPGPPVISVAWCQTCQQINVPRLANTRRGKNKIRTCSQHASGEVPPSGDNNLFVKVYPQFLVPFVNKVVRLRLVYTDPKVERLVGEYAHLKHGTDAEPMSETSHLVRNMRSLRLQLNYSQSVPGLPEVRLDENHGGVKRLRRVRYRNMAVRWLDLDHRKSRVSMVGDGFELTLQTPDPAMTADDFFDGNGELPAALGTYIRVLDTCPDQKLHFSARLFRWFNQSMSSEYLGDVNT